MLVRSYNLIDIKNYENNTGNNILSFFDEIKISNILDLIVLGNGNCSTDRAGELLDEYLHNGGTLLDAILEIKKQLIGIGDNDEEHEDSEVLDITEYESLTDLYIHFSMQLMSVGLSYTEFWSMNTKEMYKVFNSIVIKLQNDTNRELSNYHTLAAMVGGAVWGKLQKEPPKVDIVNKKNNSDEENITMLAAQLKAFAVAHNKKLEKGE